MRRVAQILTIGSCVALMLLCSSTLLGIWASQGNELVLPDANTLRVDRSGLTRQHISYQLALNQGWNRLRQQLVRHGWTRIKTPNFERSTGTFIRQSWFGTVREVATVSVGIEKRGEVEIWVVRCFRMYRWTTCL
jgi:hypothetical protein